jgi:hypothetical protein
MECSVCLGKTPKRVDDFGEHEGIRRELLWFQYGGKVQSIFRHIASESTSFVAQTHRLIDLKTGYVVEIHDCFKQGKLVFRADGELPFTDDETDQLVHLLKYAFRLTETRGQKPYITQEITKEDIFICLQRLPDNAGWPRVVAEVSEHIEKRLGKRFEVSQRTLQYLLKSWGLTLQTAKKVAKIAQE